MTATVGNSAHAQQVEKILKIALDNAATEVRLGVGAPPRVLIDGQWRPIGKTPLGADDVQALVSAILPPGGDPASFSFTTALGDCAAALLDVQGTKVLVLKPPAGPPPAADGPLELDIPGTDAPAAEAEAADLASKPRLDEAAVGQAGERVGERELLEGCTPLALPLPFVVELSVTEAGKQELLPRVGAVIHVGAAGLVEGDMGIERLFEPAGVPQHKVAGLQRGGADAKHLTGAGTIEEFGEECRRPRGITHRAIEVHELEIGIGEVEPLAQGFAVAAGLLQIALRADEFSAQQHEPAEVVVGGADAAGRAECLHPFEHINECVVRLVGPSRLKQGEARIAHDGRVQNALR